MALLSTLVTISLEESWLGCNLSELQLSQGPSSWLDYEICIMTAQNISTGVFNTSPLLPAFPYQSFHVLFGEIVHKSSVAML
jgi:hypothetical protein